MSFARVANGALFLTIFRLGTLFIFIFVYGVFRIFGKKISAGLRDATREICEACNPEPNAAVIDSQSVKNSETGGDKGFDAAKKVSGIKRHIVVDTTGLIMKVVFHSASVQDREGPLFQERCRSTRIEIKEGEQVDASGKKTKLLEGIQGFDHHEDRKKG